MAKDTAYKIHCDCGDVTLTLHRSPIVHAYCHCQDCRDLLSIPINALAAWDRNDVSITKGEDRFIEYKYPDKAMKRYVCQSCGATIFNTNAYDWVVVSQSLIRKCYGDQLPAELASDKHFFYEERVIDVRDSLPKFLKGVDGRLYEDS